MGEVRVWRLLASSREELELTQLHRTWSSSQAVGGFLAERDYERKEITPFKMFEALILKRLFISLRSNL